MSRGGRRGGRCKCWPKAGESRQRGVSSLTGWAENLPLRRAAPENLWTAKKGDTYSMTT